MLSSPFGEIQLLDELDYVFGSSANSRNYEREISLSSMERPYSVHGILLDGISAVVVGAGGGPTEVRPHSAIISGDRLFLAIGNKIVCFQLHGLTLLWSIEADMASCFGVYVSPGHGALICHGELAISRFSAEGTILWTQSGRDIFTGPLTLDQDFIVAQDFEDRLYRFRYLDGSPCLHQIEGCPPCPSF